MNQLTLEPIYSEGFNNIQKPGTANGGGGLSPLEETEEPAESEYMGRSGDRVTEFDGEKNDWRQYFTKEELTTAFEKIKSGEDPNEEE